MRREAKHMNLSDHIIQEAFENDWHTCFYQPKVEPSIEKVTGVEALFRLDIPEEGIFSPGVFIDRAFALGYEEEIFFSVLEQSLTEVKSLSSHLNLAVNISKKVLANPDNVEKVRELLWNTSFKAKQLTFKLSENDQLDDQLCEQIKRFQSLGIKISIDDFGIGYSDMNKVMSLNVDEVKFDKSIVNSAEPARSDLVKRTLAYCKESGIETVAEGVEDTDTHQLVHQLGFDSYQGFLYSKPLPLTDLRLVM
ncbi:EAL domain-containing protein [Vibrio crassostreae]|uniref:EAL domain-containing protein n=1 Tax=Vibrio crassostreae TaxID=246167 RepID=UPI00200A9CFC|nr:EAL domain-containing protein [Vibrio crassostreae]UPR31736.1 EAL domain-containing protein [Vibrio crassostreae]